MVNQSRVARMTEEHTQQRPAVGSIDMNASLIRAGHSVLLSPNSKFVPQSDYIDTVEKKRNQDVLMGSAARSFGNVDLRNSPGHYEANMTAAAQEQMVKLTPHHLPISKAAPQYHGNSFSTGYALPMPHIDLRAPNMP